MSTKQWLATQERPRADVHVMPIKDLLPHREAVDCPCEPWQEPILRDDHSVGWIITHHAADGRE